MPLLPNTHIAERGVSFHDPSPITLHNLQEKLSHRRILLYQPHLRESRALLYSLYPTPHLRCFSFTKNKTHEINRVFCLVGRTGFEPVKAQGRLISLIQRFPKGMDYIFTISGVPVSSLYGALQIGVPTVLPCYK